MKSTSQFAELLTEDLDVVSDRISAESHSSQKQLLLHSIEQALSETVRDRDMLRWLAIAQILLSGSYLFVDEIEAVRLFREFLELANKVKSPEIKDSALTVSGLLGNRAREHLGNQAESIQALLKQTSGRVNSHRQSTLLSAMERKVAASDRQAFSRKSRAFKIPELDITKAAQNVAEDAAGDWYQDPWGWPEVAWLGKSGAKVVASRLSQDSCGWTVPLDVSKRHGGVRPAIIMNPLDRVAYQAIADELSLEATADLPTWVYGWRLMRSGPSKGVYESNHAEWSRFSGRVTTFSKSYKFTAHLDIRSFFSTVDVSRLLAQLTRRYRKAAVIDRLEAYLCAWQARPNGAGIPQRALASSVLAHVALRPLDAFINSVGETVGASRWMDDIWLHSNDERLLRASLKEIEDILAEARLGLNADKTEVFPSEQAEKTVNLVDVYDESGDDAALSVEELAAEPPFQVSKKVAKLLKSKDFTSLDHFPEDGWTQFSYLSKPLAKIFRVSGNWRRFVDTYVEFAQSHASAGSLSVASWAEMFPNTAEDAAKKIQDFFSLNVVESSQRLLTPLAAQRLVAWSSHFGPGGLEAFDFQRDTVTSDAFRLRGIIFSALRLQAVKKQAAAASAADELTAQYLADTNFEAPPLSARFEAE